MISMDLSSRLKRRNVKKKRKKERKKKGIGIANAASSVVLRDLPKADVSRGSNTEKGIAKVSFEVLTAN